MSEPRSRQKIVSSLRHELARYAVVSLYLYICFAAITLFKIAVLRAHGIEYAPFGLAAVKALILGKFVLIGEALHVGERHQRSQLVFALFHKIGSFIVLLLVLSFVEEMIVAAIHGRPIADAVYDIAGGTWLEVVASCLLMCLILVPYFAFQAIGEEMGRERLRDLFFDRPLRHS